MADAATLDRVTVRYGRQPALREVTASFPVGAVGLLGRNGAGKSTLLRALLGFLPPERGRMEVLGLDVARAPLQIRARLGYMPENDAYIPGMNAVSYVAYCAELAGLPAADAMGRAHEVLYYVGLGEARYRALETYSTGMKGRIKLAQALVHDPDLVFLDEPTNGMDPRGRDDMLALIADIARNKGISLILSSHLLPDVEATCDHVVVLDRGVVVAAGPIRELKRHEARVIEVRVKGEARPFVAALAAEGVECSAGGAELLRLFVPDSWTPQTVFRRALEHGLQVRHLRVSTPTLEDVFAGAIAQEP